MRKTLLAAAFALLLAGPASAHQAPAGWAYDVECCDTKDCAQVDSARVEEVQGGYRVRLSPGQHPLVGVEVDTFIPHGDPKIRVSGDENKHVCVGRYGYIFCIYVPLGGV